MKKQLMEKIKESLLSIIPITMIVILLHITKISSLNSKELKLFILGAIFMIIGMGLFTLGANVAMTPMGEHVGEVLIKSRKLWFIIIASCTLGILITIAEPDLNVLANQVPVNSIILIITVAIGVGLFLVLALLRIIFKINLSILLLIFYSLIFILCIFVKKEFLPMAFDSGGVTTGPITVPFIMSLGVGIAALAGENKSQENSFGLIALCSIGPIIAVLILGLFTKGTPIYQVEQIDLSSSIFHLFIHGIFDFTKSVTIALLPIIIFFFIFQAIFIHLPKQRLIRILIGIIYTYIGLILFLTAVNIGFMPAGQKIGKTIGSSSYSWVLVPIGLIMGFVVVLAEPAVHVLNKQVEELSGGTISKRSMLISLSLGVGLSIALSMLRILFGFSILWYLIPGYAISLLLTFFVPKIYTAIAFDSGGVASGPMTAGFILPFAVGACSTILGEQNIMQGAFGIVAMVAMTPLLTIQILGFIAIMKQKRIEKSLQPRKIDVDDDQIIYFN